MNKDTLAAVISKSGTSMEHVVRGTVETISGLVREEKVQAPAVIVIGETAGYSFLSSKKKKLSGIHVGLTGTRTFIDKQKEKLEKEGAIVRQLDLCEIRKTITPQFIKVLHHITEYDAAAFTSTNAVHIFMEQLVEEEIDIRKLFSVELIVIGTGTRDALKSYGLAADDMPAVYTTEAIAELLAKRDKSERLLIPRAGNGSKRLSEILDQAGKPYEEVVIYEPVHNPELKKELLEQSGPLDYITFGSAEGVRRFFDGLEDSNSYPCLHKTRFVCIGEVTRSMLTKYTTAECITAESCTVEGIVDAIKNDVKGLI